MHNNITAFIQEAADYPFLFLLLVLFFFAITMLVIGIIAYTILFFVTKKTALTGIMKVDLTLRVKPPQEEPDELTGLPKSVNLALGEFLIPMHDPDGIKKDRLDPRPGPFALIKTRKYALGILLRRYCTQFELSGLQGDAAWDLLQELLKKTDYCEDMGMFYQDLRSGALSGFGCAAFEKDPKSPCVLRVLTEIPRSVSDLYQGETQCAAQELCMTLEYCRPAVKK